MIGTKQWIALGALSAAVAATWGPFLMSEEPPLRHPDEEEGEELRPPPKEPGAAASESGSSARALAARADADEPAPVEPTPAQPGALALNLGQLAELRTLFPRAEKPGLDALAAGWGPVPAAVRGGAPGPMGAVAEDSTAAERFLAGNPLSAILYTKEAPCALLGPHVVRPGQEPVHGLTIVEIEPRAVLLSNAGATLRIELPPVRSRPAAKTEEDSQDSAEREEADEVNDEKSEGADA